MEEQEKSSDFSESTLYQEIKQDIITTTFKHKKIRKDRSEMTFSQRFKLQLKLLNRHHLLLHTTTNPNHLMVQN